jgi:hypothetical protein
MTSLLLQRKLKKLRRKKEEKEKLEINIDESALLTSVLRGCIQKGQLYDALFVLRENQ